jgi:hypothetical protein
MSEYTPDRWVIIKITTPKETLYKVFASWSGGYTGSDSWKMNSGITHATLVDTHWEFAGYSGSVYSCHKESYGTNGYGSSVLQRFIDSAPDQGARIEIMPESTDWAVIPYDALQQFVAGGEQA